MQHLLTWHVSVINKIPTEEVTAEFWGADFLSDRRR